MNEEKRDLIEGPQMAPPAPPNPLRLRNSERVEFEKVPAPGMCDECLEQVATVHATEVVQGQKQEAHFCVTCATKKPGLVVAPDEFFYGKRDSVLLKRGERERLPKRRESVSYELGLDSHKMFITLGLYPDGRVGEVFVSTAKDGSMLRTALSSWAVAVSKALQWGVPLAEIVKTFKAVRCDEGYAKCDAIPAIHEQPVSSSWDAVAKLLEAVTDENGKLRP